MKHSKQNLYKKIITFFRLQSWPELFPTLHQMLETGRDECVEGSFSTFVKLCEDCQDQLDSEEMEPVLNTLIQVGIL